MSRIEGVLKALKGQGRKALIPYITAGDPHPDVTVDLMHTLVKAGADLSSSVFLSPTRWRTGRLYSWPASGHWFMAPPCDR